MTDSPLNFFDWMNVANTPEAYLQYSIPRIQEALGTSAELAVYRHAYGGLVVWYSTKPDQPVGSYVPQVKDTPFEQVLNGANQAKQGDLVVLPLKSGTGIFALLAIEHGAGSQMANLEMMAMQLGIVLHNLHLQVLLKRQMALISEFNTAETIQDVVAKIAREVLDRKQFLTLNRFEMSDSGAMNGAHVVYSANREQVFETQQSLSVSPSYLAFVHHTLQQDGELLISDIQADSRLDADGRAWLKSNQIVSIYNLPIKIRGEMLYFISIIDTKRAIALSDEERQILRNVCLQAASIIEKRDLLTSTETDLQEVQILYALTGDLIGAQDYADILRVLHKHVGKGTRNVNLSEFIYDDEGHLANVYIRYVINKGDAKEVNVPWFQDMTPERLAEAQQYVERIGTDLEVIPSYEEASKELPILKELMKQGVQSSITIPLLEGTRRIRQITLAWDQPHAFDERVYRLMHSAQSQIALVLKSREILATTRQSAEQSSAEVRILSLMNELTNTGNRIEDEKTIVDRTAQLLYEYAHVDHVGIVMIQNDNRAIVVSEYPDSGNAGHEVEYNDDSIVGMLAKKRAPIMIANVPESTMLTELSRKALEQAKSGSVYFIPMFNLDGRVIGSIGLDYYQPDTPFDPSTLRMAETLGSQLAINIQRLHLLAESEKRAQQMERIAEFGQVVQGSFQITDIISTTLRSAKEILVFDYMGFLLIEQSSGILRLSGQYWDLDDRINLPGESILEDENSIAHRAYQTRTMLRIDMIQSDWEWKHPRSNELNSMMATPLVSAGMVLGVIEIGSKNPNAFSNADVAALQQIANQVAVALNNSETYAQSQKIARNKVLANEIIAKLQRQADVNDILNVAATELGIALGAKRARIRLGQPSKEPSGDKRG